MVVSARSRALLVAFSVGTAIVLVSAKWAIAKLGWDFVIALPLVTSLLGGVIFVLAIMLAGVLSDFKESERLVSELASTLRRLHADVGLIAEGQRLADMRRAIADVSATLTEDLVKGEEVRTGRMLAALDRLDALVVATTNEDGANSAVRTVQVNIAGLTRIMDRLETIVETTFLQAGYLFAGLAVAGALTILSFTRIEPLGQALVLHAFASFLLSGLFLLIRDLDNPFDGSLAVSVSQIEKVNAWLRKG